ncbi:hypothetical protein BD770DRAFT_446981 [Pilaira anomala]|nr:hypothetical protein BD770DRAFT_446981 [Pilaira anomala]
MTGVAMIGVALTNTGVALVVVAMMTKVVARGLNARVPAPIRKIDKECNRESFTTRVLFETPAIAAYSQSKQVTLIIQTALSRKSVVFEFPSTTFNTRIDACKLILEQIGPVVGNGFNPISLRGSGASGKLLIISTEFRDTLHTAKAIQMKFQYSWTDLSPILTPAFQDLTHMLYLEDWDDFAPASFKRAQPVCYDCRKSGHIKTDCPTLTKMKCFICNQTGHTRRRCKTSVPVIEEGTFTQSSFEDELDEYRTRQNNVIMDDMNPYDYILDEDILMTEAEDTIEDHLYDHDDPMDVDVFDLHDDPMDVDVASTNDASLPEEIVVIEYNVNEEETDEGNIQIVQEAHVKTNSINHVTCNVQLDVHSSDATTVLLSSEEEE